MERKEGHRLEILGPCSPAEGLHLTERIGSHGLFQHEHCHFGQMPALSAVREAL